jgi:superfamily I DNA/RNA helicase
MTRAEQLLVLSHAQERTLYGRRTAQRPSPFLLEIEAHYKKKAPAPTREKHRNPKKNNQLELF